MHISLFLSAIHALNLAEFQILTDTSRLMWGMAWFVVHFPLNAWRLGLSVQIYTPNLNLQP